MAISVLQSIARSQTFVSAAVGGDTRNGDAGLPPGVATVLSAMPQTCATKKFKLEPSFLLSAAIVSGLIMHSLDGALSSRVPRACHQFVTLNSAAAPSIPSHCISLLLLHSTMPGTLSDQPPTSFHRCSPIHAPLWHPARPPSHPHLAWILPTPQDVPRPRQT